MKSLAAKLGVDLFGVADLKRLQGVPADMGGDCTLCVDQCPYGALRLVSFADHPERREDVLDVKACRGEDNCLFASRSAPGRKGEWAPGTEIQKGGHMNQDKKYVIQTDIKYAGLKKSMSKPLKRPVITTGSTRPCAGSTSPWCAWAYSRAIFAGTNMRRKMNSFMLCRANCLSISGMRTVEVAPRQGIVVPRGVSHRPRAPDRTLVLMVEAATVTPTGDV